MTGFTELDYRTKKLYTRRLKNIFKKQMELQQLLLPNAVRFVTLVEFAGRSDLYKSHKSGWPSSDRFVSDECILCNGCSGRC